MSEKRKNKEVFEDLKNIGLVLGGVVVGNLIDVGTQKILKLDNSIPLAGLGEIKKFISPTVRIVGGGAGAYLVPNKYTRLVLGGVAISGASSMVNYGIKKVLNKDVSDVNDMSGFGEIEELEDEEAIDIIREENILENYEPNLPELSIDGIRRTDKMEIIEPIGTVLNTKDFEDEDEFDEAEII